MAAFSRNNRAAYAAQDNRPRKLALLLVAAFTAPRGTRGGCYSTNICAKGEIRCWGARFFFGASAAPTCLFLHCALVGFFFPTH